MKKSTNESVTVMDPSAPTFHVTDKLAQEQAVVYYRTPHSQRVKELVQYSPLQTFTSLKDLPLTGGYVVMPFVVTTECPLIFIEPDEIKEYPLPSPATRASTHTLRTDEESQRTAYHRTFSTAHQLLTDGLLQKIVLSRRLHVEWDKEQPHDDENHRQLMEKGLSYFLQACHDRPNSYVSFWWTAQSGAWLVATPEPLLEQQASAWKTVALAGTLPWSEDAAPVWNEKNREEQAIVRRFITAQLEGLARQLNISETYSLRSGNIQHLCTDFTFNLHSAETVREVLMRLHPTPAVCGLPRENARQAILKDENSPRRYYAGFSGPLCLQDETHLYVSLRCMEFETHHATLYAGGGLMPESQETDEWEETKRKMQTMWNLL